MKVSITTLFTIAALPLAPMAQANIYAVGPLFPGTGCTHSSLRAALTDAAANPNGPHEIKLAFATDTSLSYSGVTPNAETYLQDPLADISVTGGYALCSDTSPQAGEYTVLEYQNPVLDQGYSMIKLSNGYANPRRSVTLRKLIFRGDSGADVTGPARGGAIYMFNNLDLNLHDVQIKYFNAENGGAISVMSWGSPDARPSPSATRFSRITWPSMRVARSTQRTM